MFGPKQRLCAAATNFDERCEGGINKDWRRIALGIEPNDLDNALIAPVRDLDLFGTTQLLVTGHALNGIAVIAGVKRPKDRGVAMLQFNFAKESQADCGVGIEFTDRATDGKKLRGRDEVFVPVVKRGW